MTTRVKIVTTALASVNTKEREKARGKEREKARGKEKGPTTTMEREKGPRVAIIIIIGVRSKTL